MNRLNMESCGNFSWRLDPQLWTVSNMPYPRSRYRECEESPKWLCYLGRLIGGADVTLDLQLYT